MAAKRKRTMADAMDMIVGLLDQSFGMYAGNQSGNSEDSKKLYELLRAMEPSNLTDVQIDFILRILSGAMAGLREEYRSRFGIKVREWKPKKSSPASVRRSYGYEFRLGQDWIDHPSVEILPDGESIYVSEPYGLDETSLRQILETAEGKFRVSISANRSTHYPGETIRVEFRRKTVGQKQKE